VGVEKRRESRFQPDQIATVTVLGLRPGPSLQVSVLDMSGSGLRLLSGLPIPCGALVEIAGNDIVMSGTVCRCEPEQDSYELGVQITEIAPASKSSADVQKRLDLAL
jgi:hypothetical protein